ncbi:NAD synthetase [Coleofasciculus sp. LEGE 07092]|nr:NAD synthetase [Coleofasciculus sp. LEGE 07081]MBE9151161.1 NAD synthetase [Coleofasciculus sp. LEGE 07092]
MENNVIDLVIGGLAITILAGGLLMLFNGISAFGDKDK